MTRVIFRVSTPNSSLPDIETIQIEDVNAAHESSKALTCASATF